jgi:RNA polymerase sigma-70 factor (ECF subfamily)
MRPKASLIADEKRLIQRLAQGEDAALDALMAALERPVFSLVLGILRDRQAAEDVVSETFVKVWRGAKDYDPGKGRLASWVFSIAHHRAIDVLRARRARQAVGLTPEGDLGAFEKAGPRGTSPWQREAVQAALQQLPAPQREAVLLAYFEGLSREEMAQRLRIPLGTVKTRLREGLIKLKQLYQDPEAAYREL